MMCGFLKLVMTGSLPSSRPALSLGYGLRDWASPWASGRERAVSEAGGRQARCGPCPSGECLVLAGTEQWTVFGLSSSEPSSEAARQSRERQQSGGRLRRETARAHLLSSVPTTAQQTDGLGNPCRLARRVYT